MGRAVLAGGLDEDAAIDALGFKDLGLAYAVQRNIRMRESLLSFIAPDSTAWRILIEVYIAQGEGKKVSISDVSLMIGIPQSTSLRFLMILQDRGMLERIADCKDRRRSWTRLTRAGFDAVTTVLRDLAKDVNSVPQPCG